MSFEATEKDPVDGLAERQLESLRGLLRRDFLTGADWGRALSETALMAREALAAHTALVALYDAGMNSPTVAVVMRRGVPFGKSIT